MVVDTWSFKKCVAFLVQESKAGGAPVPLATSFVLCFTNIGRVYYLVTARHNLECSNKDKMLWARFNTTDRHFVDIEVPYENWEQHHSTDVAVTLIDLPDEVQHVTSYVPTSALLSDRILKELPLYEDMRVFIPSLFAQFYGKTIMHPILRTGRLALVPEEKLIVTLGPNTKGQEAHGYLIECLMWGGCSGSPVFVHDYWKGQNQSEDKVEGGSARLLGLINGHYPQQSEIEIKTPLNAAQANHSVSGANENACTASAQQNCNTEIAHGNNEGKEDLVAKIKLNLNAGIAVVIPADAILELLNYEHIAKARAIKQRDPKSRANIMQ